MIQENLQALIQHLANPQNTQLSAKQMQQLLLNVQKKFRYHKIPQQTSKANKTNKTKKIRRFFNKNSFKNYIKNRLRNLFHKSVGQMKDRVDSQTIMTKNSNIESMGGKSKFKKSTKRRKSFKQMKFLSKLRNGFKISNNEELACPICLEILVSPALTTCGHVFCLQCIDESLIFAQTCPTCRQNIKFSQPICCRALENLIRTLVRMTEIQMLEYQARLAKFSSWRQRRFLEYNALQAGTLIDVRDTESIWCQGNILKIYCKKNIITGQLETFSLLIHYQRWNKLYNEIIEVPSSRLAPLNSFSGRIDIPRYNLSEVDDNLRGSVVSGPAIRIQFANTNHFPNINFRLDLLNNMDEILEFSQAESLSQAFQQELQNDEEQEQQNQEFMSEQAADDPAIPNDNTQFQDYLNYFRNRLNQNRFTQLIPVPTSIQNSGRPRLLNLQMGFDSPEEQLRSQNLQEERYESNDDSLLGPINQQSQQSVQFEERGLIEQIDPMSQSEAQQMFQNNNQSQRKQNEGSEQEADHD